MRSSVQRLVVIVGCLVAWIPFISYSQGHFLIYFKDKPAYSLSEVVLTPRSIERRAKSDVVLDSTDAPVYGAYIDSVRSKGWPILNSSKWLNAVEVFSASEKLDSLYLQERWSFAREVRWVRPVRDTAKADKKNARKERSRRAGLVSDGYGNSKAQNQQICIDEMHRMGFTGRGVLIAVFDGGFSRVNSISLFDSLFVQKRIKYEYNVELQNKDVYNYSMHGTQVLSNIASYAPGKIIGGAYHADVALFRTEVEATEYPIEEWYWLLAAEKADSIGADLINSSLGYTTFDKSVFDYNTGQMDGQTALITRAAKMAAAKGILVVSSAGNTGRSTWKIISAPADAPGILSVAAVDDKGQPAGFSAYGPTADGRVKPELAAMGLGATVTDGADGVTRANGTSFASPILAGMMAGLIEAFPEFSVKELIEIAIKSASQYLAPDNRLGYGIPCFTEAYLLGLNKPKSQVRPHSSYLIPNPVSDQNLSLVLPEDKVGKPVPLALYDRTGKLLWKYTLPKADVLNALPFQTKDLIAGLYVWKIEFPEGIQLVRMVKD